MMSTKNIIKYGLLWGLLIWAMVVRGQQVEILHEGEDPVWLSEQHQFVWDKVIPLHFEAGRAVYEVHHAPKVFRLATETGYSSWFFVGDKDRVTVTVLNTDPLNIKVEGDVSGTYFYELENVSREYTRGKLEMTDDYMKAWLENVSGKSTVGAIKEASGFRVYGRGGSGYGKGTFGGSTGEGEYAVGSERKDRAGFEKRGEGYRQAGGRVGFIHEGVYSGLCVLFLLLPVRVAGTD